MHRLTFAGLFMVASSTSSAIAYECKRADVLLALDASSSIASEDVQEQANRVLNAIETIRSSDSAVDLKILEAVAFTGILEHSSIHWAGADSESRVEALVDAFPRLAIKQPDSTAFAPLLRYARVKFNGRPDGERRDRRPILIVITDGRGESDQREELVEMIDALRMDGFKPMPRSSADWDAIRRLQSIERGYLDELRRFFGSSMDSIAIPVGSRYGRTLGELTSDSIENVDGLQRRIERLIRCIV